MPFAGHYKLCTSYDRLNFTMLLYENPIGCTKLISTNPVAQLWAGLGHG